MKHILIASAKAPTKDTFNEFACELVKWGQEIGFNVAGVMVTDGPACANIVVKGIGDGFEKFANALTMALMPARWCEDSGAGFQEGYHATK